MNLTHVKKLELDEIKRIYDTHMHEAFPPSELRPYENMKLLHNSGNYVCYGLYEDETLLAYAYFALKKGGSYILLDYLAVLSGKRGGGIGSRFLTLIREEMREFDGVLIEVESLESAETDEETAVRTRRIDFYMRNGFEKTDAKCLLYGVDFSIMALPIKKPVPQSEIVLSELSSIYHVMFDDVLYSRICHPFLRKSTDAG